MNYIYNKSNNKSNLASLLLDSSLIFQSQIEMYDTKIIQCGEYIQVYKYQRRKDKKKKNIEKVKEEKNFFYDITKVDTDDLEKIKEKKEEKKVIVNKIEERNIKRSKFQLQRLVKSNENIFKTFITLTFANFEKIKIDNKDLYYWLCPNIIINFDYTIIKQNNYVSIFDSFDFNKKIENYTSIKKANEKFNIWHSNFKKRLKNDFKYVCVPEFQKNGTVHYHLLTNINYTDFDLLSKDEKKIFKRGKGWQIFRTVNSWKYGFSNVIDLKNINIVGYISKYMTKDIDNRLFSKHRYFYSRGLLKPSVLYIDSSVNNRLTKILDLDYYKSYCNNYTDLNGEIIEFIEYKKMQNVDILEFFNNS